MTKTIAASRSPYRPARALTLSLLAALTLALLACLNLPTQRDLPDGGRRVLFVGNSLTYVNDLPRTIADLAASVNDTPLVYRAATQPNFSLEDHWLTGVASAIARDQWEFVVMQQGPSSLPENQVYLRDWAIRLDSAARAAGARSALYQVWPAAQYASSFDAVRESYRAAAVAVNGMFIPAGEAWRAAWARDSTLALYDADAFHPSPLGTYLAALVHFEMLYDRPATDLPDVVVVNGITFGVSAATARLLQEAAHETVLAWGIR